MKNLFVDDYSFYELLDQNIIDKIQKFLSNYNLKTKEYLIRLKLDMSKLSKLDNMYIYSYVIDNLYNCSDDFTLMDDFLADYDKDLGTFIRLTSTHDVDISTIKEKVEQLSVDCNINFVMIEERKKDNVKYKEYLNNKDILGTVLYQICAKGRYKSFEGETNYCSKNVYISKPSKEEIDSFVDRCCNSEHPNDLFDLDKDTVQTFINELVIAR